MTSFRSPRFSLFRALRAFAVGALVGLAWLASMAADHRVTVTERVSLPVSPDRAWAVVNDFLKWQTWHPAFASTALVSGDGRTPGSVRLLSAKDGAKFTEELLEYDAAAHRVSYRILESPAPVRAYRSTLEVKPAPGGCIIVWSSEFGVKEGTAEDDAKKAIAAIYRLGLDHLAAYFSSQAASR